MRKEPIGKGKAASQVATTQNVPTTARAGETRIGQVQRLQKAEEQILRSVMRGQKITQQKMAWQCCRK